MTLTGKTILVTGGTGFIGGRLVEKLFLEQRARIRVLVRNFSRASRIARFPLEMIGGDITDEATVDAAVAGCDTVFHCAYDFSDSRERQERVGTFGTENIVKAVLKHSVRRLVHVSTVSVYEPTPDGALDETAPKEPYGWTYADTKLAAEQLVLGYHHRNGLPVAVVQPTIVYGPFAQSWTIGPVRQLKNGKVVLVDGGSGYCNAVYVDDVTDAMILAAIKEHAVGETFLISAAKPVTWRDFFGAYEKILGLKATISLRAEEIEKRLQRPQGPFHGVSSLMRDPLRVLRLSPVHRFYQLVKNWIPQGLKEPIKSRMSSKPIYLPDVQKLALYRARTRVCIDKAHRLLGYEPAFDLERGMALTARFIHWAGLA